MSGQPSAAEIRRVLRENGHEVPDRGRISESDTELYEQITGAVTADDFGPDMPGDGDVSRETGSEPLQPERTPGSIPAEPARARARRLWDRKPRPRKKRARTSRGTGARSAAADRIPVAPLLERFWLELAHAARPLPPLQKVLTAQAPMAGIVLEDAARGTVADRAFLQPLARQEERLEAVNAMLGPPAWVLMIMRFGSVELEQARDEHDRLLVDHSGAPVMVPVRDPATGRPAYDDRTRIMIGGLRLALMSWLKISRASAAQIQARAQEMGELSDQADELIAWFLAPPDPAQRFSDVQREARQYATDFIYRGPGTGTADVSRETGPEPETAAAPVPAVPGGQLVAASPLPGPDARTLRFTPPDQRVPSQVVPPAPMPQG